MRKSLLSNSELFEASQEESVYSTTCLVCARVKYEPCSLDCDHVFCTKCLQLYGKIFSSNSPPVDIPCPTCRKVTQLPDGGLEGLRCQKGRKSQVSVYTRYSQVGGRGQHVCDVCAGPGHLSDESPDNYCIQCLIHLCNKCVKIHDQNPMFKRHETMCLPIQGISWVHCPTHKLRRNSFFCVECQDLLCTICILQQHVGHETVTASDGINVLKDKIKLQLNLVRPVLAKLILRTTRSTEVSCSDMTQVLMTERDLRPKTPTGRIYAREWQGSSPHLGRKYPAETTDRPQRKHSAGTAGEQTVGTSQFHNDMLRLICAHTENIEQIFEWSFTALKMGRLGKILQDFSTLHSRLTTVLELDMVVLKEKFERFQSFPNSYSSHKFPVGISRFPGSISEDSIASYARSDHHNDHEHSLLMQPVLVWKTELLVEEAADVRYPTSCAFTPNGNLVVTEYGTHHKHEVEQVKLFDPRGTSLGIKCEQNLRPLGVAVDERGHILMTDCNSKKVKIYSESGQLISEFGKGLFGWPYGLCVNSKGLIIVTDVFNDIVTIFQPDGKKVKQFGSSGHAKNKFCNPYHITVDHQDNIIVSDYGNDCLKLFSTYGEFINTYPDTSSTSQDTSCQFRRPTGVCITPQRNILVTDSRHHLSLLSSSGKYVRNFLPQHETLRSPEAISCNVHGRLAITDHCSNHTVSIKVFNMYGQ